MLSGQADLQQALRFKKPIREAQREISRKQNPLIRILRRLSAPEVIHGLQSEPGEMNQTAAVTQGQRKPHLQSYRRTGTWG